MEIVFVPERSIVSEENARRELGDRYEEGQTYIRSWTWTPNTDTGRWELRLYDVGPVGARTPTFTETADIYEAVAERLWDVIALTESENWASCSIGHGWCGIGTSHRHRIESVDTPRPAPDNTVTPEEHSGAGEGHDMKTIGRVGIVMTRIMALLDMKRLVKACRASVGLGVGIGMIVAPQEMSQ